MEESIFGSNILAHMKGEAADKIGNDKNEFNKLFDLEDEFDEILNQGFQFQITSILSMLKNKRQNILFSATMTDEVDTMIEEYFDFPEEEFHIPSVEVELGKIAGSNFFIQQGGDQSHALSAKTAARQKMWQAEYTLHRRRQLPL